MDETLQAPVRQETEDQQPLQTAEENASVDEAQAEARPDVEHMTPEEVDKLLISKLKHKELHAEGLVKRYGKRTVADHVTFNVKQGEIVGLLGPNGAGKTTSFYMTTGLVVPNEGHVDFSYEVSRSIAACEGALLVVDATQGVQAQTISNLYMAIDHDLEIIPVINKIDMPNAMPEEVEDEIVELIGCDKDDIIRASGKTGEGVEDILSAVVERIPHPEGKKDKPLQALIFDSEVQLFC